MKFFATNHVMYEADMLDILKRMYKNFSIIFKNSYDVLELATSFLKKIKKVQENQNKILLNEKDMKNIKKMFFLSICDGVEKKLLSKENFDDVIAEKIKEENSRAESIITETFNYIISYSNLSIKNFEKATGLENNSKKKKYFSTLNLMKKEIGDSKTVNDLVDKVYKFYLSDDEFTKFISIGIMVSMSDYIRNYIYDLNYITSPFKNCKKKIEKFIDAYENGRAVSAEDAKEILSLYDIGDSKLNNFAIEEEVNKHNKEVFEKEKLRQENIARVEIHYETREERMARYNNKDNEYKDVGDVKLTNEELECLELYFSVIEELTENDLEAFENKTTEFLPMLLDNYPNQLITLLIDKIQNSDIDSQIQKRVCKAVKHLI